jgi:Uri superfamily endonuclease
LTERATVLGAWIFPGGAECTLAAEVARIAAPIHGFGNSDCRRCAAHLFIWPDRLALRRRAN